jgi:TPR repeat protein
MFDRRTPILLVRTAPRPTERLFKMLLFTGGVLILLFYGPGPARAAIAPGDHLTETDRSDRGADSGLDGQFAQAMAAFEAGDTDTAVRAWQLLAGRDHAKAQFNLGVALAQGIGVSVDMTQAVYWWRRSALAGNTDAQYNLGLVYSQGRGVTKNSVIASMWWYMAAVGGDPAAQFNLGLLTAEEGGRRQDLENAAWWWQRAADQGFAHAIKALEILKADGIISEKPRP